jgi:hypothetical protein
MTKMGLMVCRACAVEADPTTSVTAERIGIDFTRTSAKNPKEREAFVEWVAAANGRVNEVIPPATDETPQSRSADIFNRTKEERNLCRQAVILRDGKRGQVVTVAMSSIEGYDSKVAFFRQSGNKLSKGINDCVMLRLSTAFEALKRAQKHGQHITIPLDEDMGQHAAEEDWEGQDLTAGSPVVDLSEEITVLKWNLRDDGYASQEEAIRHPRTSLKGLKVRLITSESKDANRLHGNNEVEAVLISDDENVSDGEGPGERDDNAHSEAMAAFHALHTFQGNFESCPGGTSPLAPNRETLSTGVRWNLQDGYDGYASQEEDVYNPTVFPSVSYAETDSHEYWQPLYPEPLPPRRKGRATAADFYDDLPETATSLTCASGSSCDQAGDVGDDASDHMMDRADSTVEELLSSIDNPARVVGW